MALAPALIDAVVAQFAAGTPYNAIGDSVGLSRNAVSGIIFRLRQAGDPRVAVARPNPVVTKAEQRDALADAWADGAVNLQVAAHRAGLTLTIAKQRWNEICAALGSQAR